MAYAVVVSLKQTLEPLLDSGRSRIKIPNSELKLIHDDLCYLKSFFDKVNSLEDNNSVEEVEKEIKEVVQNGQDLIEAHLWDLVHSGSESSISGFSGELAKLKDKLASSVKMLKAKEDYLTGDQAPVPAAFGRNNKIVGLADADVSSRINFVRNNKTVGLEDELIRLQQFLFRETPSERQVISIVGMGGVGKTTLAKEVYLHPLTMKHFDIRLFVEVDIKYQLEELLLRLFGRVVSDEMKELTVGELGESLRKSLRGRRYLIVLDDISATQMWDEIRRFLPDDENGSAIILTTRMTEVARGACDEENIIQKCFLTHEDSWKLLCEMAFSDMMDCPPQLAEVGKIIVQKSGGLPLAIVMIGKLLSRSARTAENWMAVAQNIDSSVQETNIPMFLNLSYTQLPQHLKACFLYLGLFPPNYSIPTSQLIKLWVAEGFIEPEPVAEKRLEQKAEEYLEDLVSRSLVKIHELSSSGRIKTCRIHQILLDLCVSAARQEKLFHIVNKGTAEGTRNQRRLGIQSDVAFGVMESSVSGVRSLVFICPQNQHPLQEHVFARFRWLRVLHAALIRFWEFPHEVIKLVRLRYLAITYHGELPSSISKLWNLEVLIIHPFQRINSSIFLPLEIWKLHKLRHLQCMGFDLPDPCAVVATGDGLKKLQTLSGVSARTCTEGVLARLPSLIKLGIVLEPTDHAAEISCLDAVITNLRHLESFNYAVMKHSLRSKAVSGLPSGLRKLTLFGCGFPWELMAIISQFPNLQVLKLRWFAFSGHVWELCDRGFSRLKFLKFECLDIEQLIVESDQFPVLEQLHISCCYELQEIPSGIGDIPTLRVIEVDGCSRSVVESARRIQEEQEFLGNEGLQVRIHSDVPQI